MPKVLTTDTLATQSAMPDGFGPCSGTGGGVYTAGLAGDLILPGGGSLDGGIAIDSSLSQAAFYGSTSGGAGVDIGAGLQFGYYPDGFSALNGPFTKTEVNLGFGDIGVAFGKGGKLLGATFTLGPQAPGGSVSAGYGGHTGLANPAVCAVK